MSTLVRNASPGRPRSRSYQIARRIARRFSPELAALFLDAVSRVQDHIDDAALLAAVAGGDENAVLAIVADGDLGRYLGEAGLEDALARTLNAAGATTQRQLAAVWQIQARTKALGLPFMPRFNASDPRAVLYARTLAGTLIVDIDDAQRTATRIVLALGQQRGLTTEQQARAIREIVGLPPNWANAPLNLAEELRNGRFTATRRMSAADKAAIRSRIARGTVDEAFIARMQARYAASLTNRRALNIARTESLRSSHFGQRLEWRQAQSSGVLPMSTRRFFIVTPDDRLRETHAAVPAMNPDGVGMDEAFTTPIGDFMDPPIEPNCRCGVGLAFPGLAGVL